MQQYHLQFLYQKALRFAGEAHHIQTVPGSTANYLLHISNVAMEVLTAFFETKDFNIQLALPVAILHDTIEDTDVTYDMIKNEFGEDVANGVQALTKDDSLPTKSDKMADSLRRIQACPKEFAIVKLADRITNLQKPPSHWTPAKVQIYLEEGRLIASTLKGRCVYLDERIEYMLEEYMKHTSP